MLDMTLSSSGEGFQPDCRRRKGLLFPEPQTGSQGESRAAARPLCPAPRPPGSLAAQRGVAAAVGGNEMPLISGPGSQQLIELRCARLATAPARRWGRLSCTSIRTSIFSSRLDNSAILICFRQKLGREGLPRNRLRKGNEVLRFPHRPSPPNTIAGLQESGGDGR